VWLVGVVVGVVVVVLLLLLLLLLTDFVRCLHSMRGVGCCGIRGK
jgi:hypothetical protein